MDRRRSFYLASRQDELTEPQADAGLPELSDIPYITPTNDNLRVKDRLSAHCSNFLRILFALDNFPRPD